MPRLWPALKQDLAMYASRALNRSLAPPDWLSVNLTLRCNLSCTFCTTCYDAPEMETREILELIDQAAGWGVQVFNPLGGEPLVRRDAEEILAYAAGKGMAVTLTTNGTLLHPARAARLAAIPPERLHVNISLDGLEADHDAVRGRGMFQRALAGYRALRAADDAAGQPRRTIRANAILHRQNLPRYRALLDLLEMEGFDGVQVLALFREGTAATASALWFQPEDTPALTALAEELAAWAERPQRPLRIVNRPKDLRLLPRYYAGELAPLEAPCWAGWKELYVNADGAAIMCDGALDFRRGVFGDVRTQTLREIWASPALAERRRVVKSCTTPCVQNCYLRGRSDHLAPLVVEAASQLAAPVLTPVIAPVVAPLRAVARRWRPSPPKRAVPVVLELCAVPGEEGPRLSRFLAPWRAQDAAAAAALLADPGLVEVARDRGRLDATWGVLGVEVAVRFLEGLEAAGISAEPVYLGWRGEPLLHPERRWMVERLARYPLRWVTAAPAFVAFAAATWPKIPVVSPRDLPERALVLAWDGVVTASPHDPAQRVRLGHALHDSFATIVEGFYRGGSEDP